MSAPRCTKHVHVKQCCEVKQFGCHREDCLECSAGRNCCEHCEWIR